MAVILTSGLNFKTREAFPFCYLKQYILEYNKETEFIDSNYDAAYNQKKFKNKRVCFVFANAETLIKNSGSVSKLLTFLKKLERDGIVLYPSVQDIIYIHSKIYYSDLISDKPKIVFPNTHIIMYTKKSNIRQILDEFRLKEIKFIYVKYGYIGFGKGVKRFSIDTPEIKIRQHIEEFYKKNSIDLPVIFQGENPIISDRHNEYKCLFINGKFCNFFGHGTQDGFWILNEEFDKDNAKHVKILKVAKDAFKWYKTKVSSTVVVRIDVSFYEKETFFETFYVNEIESNPTFFFNFGLLDKHGVEHDTLKIQRELAKTISKYYMECF